MSVFPNTKKPMQLCAAMVSDMPVYEATGIETTKAVVRERVTQCLCALTNTMYIGCYSLGDAFRISSVALLNAASDLLLEEYHAMRYLERHLPGMPPIYLSKWIDKVLDDHEGQREVVFKWM